MENTVTDTVGLKSFHITEEERAGTDLQDWTNRLLPSITAVMRFAEKEQIEGPGKFDKYLENDFVLLENLPCRYGVLKQDAVKHIKALDSLIPESPGKKTILFYLVDLWFIVK